MSSKKTTPPLRGTPPKEWNNSPSPKGWQAKPDGVVPKLRFPEFRGAEGWESVDFDDAIFFQEGPGIMAVDFRDEGVPLVRLSGLAGQSVSLDGCNYLDPIKVQQKWSHFRLDAGDIVVSCSASFGRPATVTDVAAGAVFYTGLVRFKSKEDRISVTYLEVFLGSPYFLQQAESFAVGGGIKHFGPSHLRQMKVPLPRIPEQQKIAECLSSVDEVIAAQARKVDALKTHKKGLMQQLFPREGETQPRLRFPEFQNAGEWEVRTIGDMFRLINGCAFKPEDWKPTGTPIIRIQNLNDPSAEFNYSQAPVLEQHRIEPGDLLFAWSGTLGSSFGARVWNGPSGVLNQHIFKVLMDEQQITLQFALLVLARVEEDIAKKAHGFKASFVHVKKSDLVKVELPLPSLPEQQRIATCLSSLDALITAETKKLEALKRHKKGLMQQLFPSVGGVAGEA